MKRQGQKILAMHTPDKINVTNFYKPSKKQY